MPISETVPQSRLLSDYLTEAELAHELGRTRRSVQRWRALRVGPAPTFVGNTVLYAAQSVRTWLRQQERQPVRRRRSA